MGIRLNLPDRLTDAPRESYQRAAGVVRARGKVAVILCRSSTSTR